jgi:hypothetical protein
MTLAEGVLINGRFHVFLLPFKWDSVLGSQTDPWLYGKFFSYDVELIHHTGCLVGYRLMPSVKQVIKYSSALALALALLSRLLLLETHIVGDTDMEAALV